MVRGYVHICDSKGYSRVLFTAMHPIVLKRKMRNYCKFYFTYADENGIRIIYAKTEILQ